MEVEIMIRPGRKVRWKKLFFAVLIFCILPSLTVQAAHKDYEADDLYQVMEQAVVWKKSEEGIRSGDLFQKGFLTYAGSTGGDWYALSLGRMGMEDDYFSYLSQLKFAVEKAYETENRFNDQKATEWHRMALTMLALGGDPTELGESPEGETINLIKDGTYGRPDQASLGDQGMNGYIYGLITLDALRYQISETVELKREFLLQQILDNQMVGGSFSLTGNEPGIDLTAMALTALAPYQYLQKSFLVQGEEKTVGEAIKQAISYLSENQSDEGDFISFGVYNLESSAQVLVALTSLGIDPVNDPRFLKNQHNVLDGLMKYQETDGSFRHQALEEGSTGESNPANTMATEQALYGLVSLYRFQAGMRGLYDFRGEQADSLKETIKALEKGIEILDSRTVQEVQEFAQIYGEIPRTERMGIKGLDGLYTKFEELDVSYDPILLEDFNENSGGPGAVTSLKDAEPVTSVLRFNQSDEEALLSLEKNLRVQDEARLTTLYEKLKKAENQDDFPEVLEKLEKMRQELTLRKEGIEALNKEILEKAYPIDQLGINDQALVEDLLLRIDELDEDEKTLVLGYEDLVLAKTRLSTSQRRNWILGIALGMLLLFLILLGLQMFKRRKKKRENKMDVEELEW